MNQSEEKHFAKTSFLEGRRDVNYWDSGSLKWSVEINAGVYEIMEKAASSVVSHFESATSSAVENQEDVLANDRTHRHKNNTNFLYSTRKKMMSGTGCREDQKNLRLGQVGMKQCSEFYRIWQGTRGKWFKQWKVSESLFTDEWILVWGLKMQLNSTN